MKHDEDAKWVTRKGARLLSKYAGCRYQGGEGLSPLRSHPKASLYLVAARIERKQQGPGRAGLGGLFNNLGFY